MKLPVKLTKVPIVEAIFEVRFKAAVPTSSILPGLLFANLAGEKTVERLPAANLPEVMRNADVNLQYAPLTRLLWGGFAVLIGDRSFGVACKLPYPGWTEFKKAILHVEALVAGANVLLEVERYSLKYTNIVPSEIGSAADTVEFELKLGDRGARDRTLQIRAEIPNGDVLHIVQIVSEGTIALADGTLRKGAVIDVDTIRLLEKINPAEFSKLLADTLDDIHLKTKAMFFSCLKPPALQKLEPVYE
jgi:uncharacterized protein (TIGR04255 family)